MNRLYIVYTDMGDYRDIAAADRWEAMRKVEQQTLGRAKPYAAEVQA